MSVAKGRMGIANKETGMFIEEKKVARLTMVETIYEMGLAKWERGSDWLGVIKMESAAFWVQELLLSLTPLLIGHWYQKLQLTYFGPQNRKNQFPE
jgi:hypothetical protein